MSWDGGTYVSPELEPPSADVLAVLREVYHGWRNEPAAHKLAFEGYRLASTNGARSQWWPAPEGAAPLDPLALGSTWLCFIPGRGLWQGASIPLRIDWLSTGPLLKLSFPAHFFHTNVYPSGKLAPQPKLEKGLLHRLCYSESESRHGWGERDTLRGKASLLKNVLLAAANTFLCVLFPSDAAQEPAYRLYHSSRALHDARVREEAVKYGAPPHETAQQMDHFDGELLVPPVPAIPWPKEAQQLAADFSTLLHDDSLADVTLRCAGEAIRAHRLVLCCRSPVFKAQLCGSMANLDSAEVDVSPEIDPGTLRTLLAFIYTGQVPPGLEGLEAQALLAAADFYALPTLVAFAARRLVALMDASNVAAALMLAHRHNCAALKAAALVFISSHAVEAMQSDEWGRLAALPRHHDGGLALIDEAMFSVARGRPPTEAELGRGRKRARATDE
jgi:hypothetical protein